MENAPEKETDVNIFLRFSINFEADNNFFVVAVNFKSDLAY